MKDLEDLAMEAKFVGVYDRNRENVILRNTAYRDGKEEGREEGIEIGIGQGSMNKSIEIAKKLLKMGLEPNKIVEATGLTINEIEKL